MRTIELSPTRPVGRELDELPRRSSPRRLHVDRPCYVSRQERGTWAWHCSLCPLPFSLASVPADNWQQAVDEATGHLRTMHATVSTASPARVQQQKHSWDVAA